MGKSIFCPVCGATGRAIGTGPTRPWVDRSTGRQIGVVVHYHCGACGYWFQQALREIYKGDRLADDEDEQDCDICGSGPRSISVLEPEAEVEILLTGRENIRRPARTADRRVVKHCEYCGSWWAECDVVREEL